MGSRQEEAAQAALPELHKKQCRRWIRAAQAVSIWLDPQCTALGQDQLLHTLHVIQQQAIAGDTLAPRRQHSLAREPLHGPAHLQQAGESAPPRPLVLAQESELHDDARLAAGMALREPETAGSNAPAPLRAPTAARRQAGWQEPPSSSREGGLAAQLRMMVSTLGCCIKYTDKGSPSGP